MSVIMTQQGIRQLNHRATYFGAGRRRALFQLWLAAIGLSCVSGPGCAVRHDFRTDPSFYGLSALHDVKLGQSEVLECDVRHLCSLRICDVQAARIRIVVTPPKDFPAVVIGVVKLRGDGREGRLIAPMCAGSAPQIILHLIVNRGDSLGLVMWPDDNDPVRRKYDIRTEPSELTDSVSEDNCRYR